MLKKLFATRVYPVQCDVVLLLLRVVCGLAIATHGYGKIHNPMAWMGPESAVPGIFQFLAALSEFGGGIAWIIGLLTPLASLGIACTMAVATYMHMVVFGDPFVNMTGGGSYELASIFFSVALVLMTLKPGRISLDRIIFGTKS